MHPKRQPPRRRRLRSLLLPIRRPRPAWPPLLLLAEWGSLIRSRPARLVRTMRRWLNRRRWAGDRLVVDSSQAFYENMGSTLLSQQPASATPNKAKNKQAWDRMYSHLETRRNQLYVWRYSFWSHWSRLCEFFSPRRYLFIPVANRTWRGNPINEAIIDSTGLQALRTCAAGMWSGM